MSSVYRHCNVLVFLRWVHGKRNQSCAECLTGESYLLRGLNFCSDPSQRGGVQKRFGQKPLVHACSVRTVHTVSVLEWHKTQ